MDEKSGSLRANAPEADSAMPVMSAMQDESRDNSPIARLHDGEASPQSTATAQAERPADRSPDRLTDRPIERRAGAPGKTNVVSYPTGASPTAKTESHATSGPASDGKAAQLVKERQPMIQANLGERDKAVKILAKSIFRELRMNGYETRQIVALSSELLGLVTSTIKPDGEASSD